MDWTGQWDYRHQQPGFGLAVSSANITSIGSGISYGSMPLAQHNTHFNPLLAVRVDDSVSESAIDDFCHTDNNREQPQEIIDEP